MKKLIFTALIGLSSISLMAQNYYHGLGVSYNLGIFKSGYTEGASVPGIVYKSTLAFEKDNKAFAISSYPFIGAFIASESGLLFGAELPLLGEFVIGDLYEECFYIGGGYSASFLASYDVGGAILGPQIGIGGQFYVADRLIGIRASYTHGLNVNREENLINPSIKESKTKYGLSIYIPID